MDHRWSQEWRNQYDLVARQLWSDMEQQVWRDARIFSGMEPPSQSPEADDDIEILNDHDLEDIGELGDPGDEIPQTSKPTQTISVGRIRLSLGFL